MRHIDKDTGKPLVDLILDEAQQKGTGKWTSQNSFDVGAPIPTINAAVEARQISALKTERVAASRVLSGPTGRFTGDRRQLIDAARHALYASKITSYAQGMSLLRIASAEYHYDIDPGEVAKVWRAGCIIRAALLGDISEAFRRDPNLGNLLLDESFRSTIGKPAVQNGWRFVVQTAVGLGIPVPGLSRVARLLRRVSQRPAAREPHPGAARFLRCAHLSPHRPRRRLSYRVDPGG